MVKLLAWTIAAIAAIGVVLLITGDENPAVKRCQESGGVVQSANHVGVGAGANGPVTVVGTTHYCTRAGQITEIW